MFIAIERQNGLWKDMDTPYNKATSSVFEEK